MSEEVNMVFLDTIEDAMKNEFVNFEVTEWLGGKIIIEKSISLRKACEFVNEVVNSCFNEDDGEYMPEIKDFSIRACTVEKYTNIALPKNVEELYDLLYATDIYGFVCERINRKQLAALIDAANEKIDYRVESGVAMVRKAVADVHALTSQFANLFGDITPDDVKAITHAIMDGRLDEEKLIEAYAKVKAETPDHVEDDIVIPKIPMEPEKRDAIKRAIELIMNEDQAGDDK